MVSGSCKEQQRAYHHARGAKWLYEQGLHVMAMSADKKDYGHHNYPLERFGKAIAYMKAHGCEKIGVIGASTTGMMALLAASYYPELSLTIAISRTERTACVSGPETMNPL